MNLFVRLYKSWKLKREAVELLNSFFRVADAMGLPPMQQQQPEFQAAKLVRVHRIARILRILNLQ